MSDQTTKKQAHFEKLSAQLNLPVSYFQKLDVSLQKQSHPLAKKVRNAIKDYFVRWCGIVPSPSYTNDIIIQCWVSISSKQDRERVMDMLSVLESNQYYSKGYRHDKATNQSYEVFQISFDKDASDD